MPFVSIHQLEAIAQLLLGTTDHVSTVLDNCGVELDQEQLNRLPVFQCASCHQWLRRHYWYWKCPNCGFENGRG